MKILSIWVMYAYHGTQIRELLRTAQYTMDNNISSFCPACSPVAENLKHSSDLSVHQPALPDERFH